MTLCEKAFEIAHGEIGVKEEEGPLNNGRIIQYHKACDSKYTSDSISWCSSFINFCLQQAGGRGTRSAMARSFLSWGKKVTKPKAGDLVIFSRGTDGISGHVGFYVKESKSHISVLGGNQSDAVNISSYAKTRVLGFRRSLDG
jgi:uncharacterized protein (TIGR02594 family)